jgi:hypothetical protein
MLRFLLSQLLLLASMGNLDEASAFAVARTRDPRRTSSPPSSSTASHASKNGGNGKSNPKSGGGGGFGARPATAPSSTRTTASSDRDSLETQWDAFASITNLEIVPPGDPGDADYAYFEVADVFVRAGPAATPDGDGGGDAAPSSGWYRTGKVASSGGTSLPESIALQRSLILWTAVHMWPRLAAGGNDAAGGIEVGYGRATLDMADGTDGALDEEEAGRVRAHVRAPVRGGGSLRDVGFRPDFNPPGFTYRRREKAAMKRRKGAMEEIAEAG